MTASRVASAASLLLAASLVLAGCGDDSDASTEDSPDIGGSSSDTTATPEPTDTTSAPDAIPTSYPEVGLEYVDFPEATKKTRAALEVFVEFDTGRLEMLQKAAMNDKVRDNAAEPVVAKYQGTVDYLQQHNAFYRGETVETFTDVVTRGNVLALDICVDGTALRFVENGQSGPPEGEARVPFRVILTRTDNGWTVTESASQEGSC